MEALKLREKPEIVELFRVLERNGLAEERQEVGNLVECVDGMEEQFQFIRKELYEVRKQLAQIQDRGVKATVARIIERAEGKVHEIGNQIRIIKENVIWVAKNAVGLCHEKGVGVLQKAVAAMKIPSAFSLLREAFASGRVGMEKEAAKVGVLGSELKAVKIHLGNIGRVLLGKEPKKSGKENPDKGILKKMQKIFVVCAGVFSRMEQRTERAMKKTEKFAGREKAKPSVRDELKRLKEKKAEVPQSPISEKENAR